MLPSLQSATFPIEAYSFTDDEGMTEACTRKLLQAMSNAPSTFHTVSPAGVGLRSIGHVGAFRPEAAKTLWPLFEASLRAREALSMGGR